MVKPTPLPVIPDDFTLLRADGLTARECEVLAWVAQGKRDGEIAGILGIACKTASKHVEHILAKLQARNRTAAVGVAQVRLERLCRKRRD